MASDLLALMWAPFLMCLVLTGIHAYLGIHVIAREVVFVDIALAQIAALGATAAFLVGFDPEDPGSYWFGLAATILGALVLALTRSRTRHVSQEAVIGVVYAVSSAAAVLLADRSPHGAEHLRTMLVGSILAVRLTDVVKVAALYAAVGLFHWLCRRPFFLISLDPMTAFRDGWRVRLWDFLFYASFGVVVASSVRVAGVLLVFSYLIVPALAGIAVGGAVSIRLLVDGRSGPGSAYSACWPRLCSTCPPAPPSPACSAWFCFLVRHPAGPPSRAGRRGADSSLRSVGSDRQRSTAMTSLLTLPCESRIARRPRVPPGLRVVGGGGPAQGRRDDRADHRAYTGHGLQAAARRGTGPGAGDHQRDPARRPQARDEPRCPRVPGFW